MKRCRDYVGVACVDGSCPKANAEEYAERCMDVISDCDDCFYYKGCEDCALADTEYCISKQNADDCAESTKLPAVVQEKEG